MGKNNYSREQRIFMIMHGVDPSTGEVIKSRGSYQDSNDLGILSSNLQRIARERGFDHPEVVSFWGGAKNFGNILKYYEALEKKEAKGKPIQNFWTTGSKEYNLKLLTKLKERSNN